MSKITEVTTADIKKLYDSNKDFKDYVNKYHNSLRHQNLSLNEVFQHQLIKEAYHLYKSGSNKSMHVW